MDVHLDGFENNITALESQGKTVMLVAFELKLVGMIAVFDTLKEDSISALKAMKKLGLKTVMLTGDNQKTAEAVAKSVGVDIFFAEVLPDKKVEVIKEFQQEGKIVLMVGDGINDAPALTQADVGMAIGTGADVAIESADVTLVKGNLTGVIKAFGLSRAIFTKIKQNLFWAFFL